MLQFQEERLFAAATILKTFDDLIQATAEYTKQRIAFGQPVLNNQTVHFRLAELATEVEALRSLVYRYVLTRRKKYKQRKKKIWTTVAALPPKIARL